VFTAEVLANERICDEHYRLILELPAFPPTQPGQFVQLLCRPPGEPASPQPVQWADGQAPQFAQPELLGRQTILRRPFSIAGRRNHAGGPVELDIIYRTVGVGTRWLSNVQAGAALSVLGPLGNAFNIHADKSAAALVGGGVGMPPMLYLAEALAAAGKRTAAFSGARTADLLPRGLLPAAQVSADGSPSACIAEFAAFGVDAAVATDDGTLGATGLVSDVLARWLDGGHARAEDLVVYSCGPEPMMRAVGEICIARGVACQLSMERVMACGMGTCQSCVCKVRADSADGWEYKLCCADGPIFDAREIVWD
jgi:dihydroorotate dehydrogenase electron transfer subunit